MARTYIELPSSGVVDMYDDIPLSFNYSIADVREPDKRDTTFSKTIQIPGTKNNNKLFTHIFEVGSSGGFNPNVKSKAIVYVDTIPVFDGYLQLTNVTVTDQNEIEYEVVIFGKLANIYTVWADDELKNVDFSDLSHTYNKANIVTSWSATIGDGYVYPMIDYGFTDGTYYNVENFFPALFLKEYVDRLFTYAGYTYTSAFFNTNFFKRLIVPYNGTKLQVTAQELINRTFKARNSSVFTYDESSTTIGDPRTRIINFDTLITTPNPAGQYNTGTYKWTVNKAGKYYVYFNTSINYKINNTTGSPITTNTLLPSTIMAIIRNTTNVAFAVLTNGTIPAQTYGASSTTTVSTNIQCSSNALLTLYPGDVIHIGVDSFCALNTGLTLTAEINAGSEFYNLPIADINEGDYLDFNNAIPDKIKIRDFFSSVIKAFNLYVEEDKNIANNLLIEPRNDFYAGGTTFDWTSKLDISRPMEIKPMGVLDARDYLFTYKEDGDYWNDRYKKTFNKIYGDRTISANNDFLVDTKKTELIFSPSPMVEIPTGTSSNRIVPQIISADTQGNVTPKSSNIRLLYWAGVIGTNQGWDFRSTLSGNSYYANTFPYAGHLDHPVTPTIDLSFGVPQQLFFIPLNYTNNNLYNKYYKKFLTEITDKDSKLVIGYFNLKPIDMLRLDFRNSIFVDGHYYRINKVIDYNPTAEDLTKVELLKIKDGVDFVATTGTVYTNEQSIGDESGMGYFPKQKSNGNSWNYQSQHFVQGNLNYVDASSIGVIVTGQQNNVGANSTGVTMFNCSGCTIMPGLSNVTLMNSSGVTVYQSNVVYQGQRQVTIVNNDDVLLFSSGTITSAQYKNIATTPVNIVPAPLSNQYLDPISLIVRNNFGTVAYVGAGLDFIAYTGYYSDVLLAMTNAFTTTTVTLTNKAQINSNWPMIAGAGIDYTATANRTTGDGTLSYYFTYKKIEF